MIIRTIGSGWQLSRQHEEPHQVFRFEDAHPVIDALPAGEPVGLLWPCLAEAIHEPWTPMTPELLAEIDKLRPGMPIHMREMPQAAKKLMDLTSSHPIWLGNDSLLYRTMPAAARLYALPSELGSEQLIRFGTDGLAHGWALTHAAGAEKGKTISVHLGQETALAAFRDGTALENSTGFSGLEGVGGQTGVGQIDPGVVLKLAEQIKDPVRLDKLLRSQSGWDGFLGRSITLVELLNSQGLDTARCQAIFEQQLKHELGAMAAALGGPDRIIYFGQSHPAITDWVKSFHQNLPILAEVTYIWLDYEDWMLEEQIYSAGPQNASNPSA